MRYGSSVSEESLRRQRSRDGDQHISTKTSKLMTSRALAITWFNQLDPQEQRDLTNKYGYHDSPEEYQIEIIHTKENEVSKDQPRWYDAYQDDLARIADQQDYTP